ncbi:phosphate acyltransferase [Alphaproteobacteria bacterium]|nr:phosphate acyltransferase [Alphaproteobacteria bacterium]GHS96904.1 phosphate acyltransferase [Alphaproteobacteria bacterium]
MPEVVLAIDAMGGDFGPSVIIEGAHLALSFFDANAFSPLKGNHAASPKTDVHFVFFGQEREIRSVLTRFPKVAAMSSIEDAPVTVNNHMKPLDALRHKEDSNLGKALQSVADGRAQAVVSAANTGAYVTLAKVIVGTLADIERPAMSAVMPNMKDRCVILDVGANVECSSALLVKFALMGEVLARVLFRKENPVVGLLNVGSEEMKGNAIVQHTGQWLHHIQEISTLRESCLPFHFHGFVEGDDIFKGVVDVIVTDGFSGNISLKSIEGSMVFVFHLMKQAAKSSFLNKMAACMTIPTVKYIKKIVDPRLYNGSVFLGLKKIAVKSHGNADAFSFSQAICVAANMALSNFSDDIEQRLKLCVEA